MVKSANNQHYKLIGVLFLISKQHKFNFQPIIVNHIPVFR